ncbi:MAG: DUF971 domain-containing protein [Gammaproteobacteria bacterium]|nr:DUF971 domain-containing protein [Gammaproteobacteria bacterium]
MTTSSLQLKPAFQIKSVSATEKDVNVIWKDGHNSFYHNLWLRDACRCEQCWQYDTLSVDYGNDPLEIELNPKTERVQIDERGNLDVIWSGKEQGHHTNFDASWLRAHCQEEQDKVHERQLWDASLDIPKLDYPKVVTTDEELFKWLDALYQYGVAILEGAPLDGDETSLTAVTDRIGILRDRHHPTNIYTLDTTDEVAKTIQSSYKLTRVPPHTDYTPYADSTLTQLLYCLKYESESNGKDGYSTVVDGFNVAKQFKAQYPEHYKMLTKPSVPTCRRRLRVEEVGGAAITKYQLDMHRLNTIIDLDEKENVRQIRYKHNTRAPFQAPHDQIEDLYAAYKAFTQFVEDRAYTKEFLLEPGQILSFDNARILHGRNEIGSFVKRFVIGGYIKAETTRSRWRILLGKQSGLSETWLTGCSDNALQLLAKRAA